MKAAIYTQFGPPNVVSIQQIKKPTPKKNEVLIKVYASSVTTADWRIRTQTVPLGFGILSQLIFGINRPRQPILGTELAGIVEAAGSLVTRFKLGDSVIAASGASLGCHAEYKCISQTAAIVKKPAKMSFAEAATLSFGGCTSLVFLKDRAKLKKGERVLVYGASGSVGTAAIQISKYLGADVTAVCSSANHQFVKALGADSAIDYTKEDVTKMNLKFDVIVDALGSLSFSKCKKILNKRGRLLLITTSLPQLLQSPFISFFSNKKIIAHPVIEDSATLQFLVDLVESDKYKSVIDQCFDLDQIVEAHKYVEQRHRKGNVAITL